MIIWKGWGILNVVVFGIVLAIVQGILSAIGLGETDSQLPLALIFIVSGMIIWFLGKALNANSGKILVDPETGEQYRMGTQHSLFFIPMHYWGLIGLVLGLYFIVAPILM
ncbi:hypothetical protein [Paenibacillus fonticola]|uniref:hypothetical protein n=1 Tax=Paenibacillus fonticola TaxID=379896 RepID=UPI000372F919|nr:hypothetical protein [Paenibacillus fonticola]